jgi:hypothetical protein
MDALLQQMVADFETRLSNPARLETLSAIYCLESNTEKWAAEEFRAMLFQNRANYNVDVKREIHFFNANNPSIGKKVDVVLFRGNNEIAMIQLKGNATYQVGQPIPLTSSYQYDLQDLYDLTEPNQPLDTYTLGGQNISTVGTQIKITVYKYYLVVLLFPYKANTIIDNTRYLWTNYTPDIPAWVTQASNHVPIYKKDNPKKNAVRGQPRRRSFVQNGLSVMCLNQPNKMPFIALLTAR